MQNNSIPWPQQYSLPLQRRWEAEPRPHSVHASSSAFNANAIDIDQEQQTPRGSLATLGVLPEAAAERRLSREDTAANVSELIPEAGPSQTFDPESRFAYESQTTSWPEGVRLEDLRGAQRQQRRSIFKISNTFTSTTAEGALKGQTASLGRRFSRTYRERMTDIKDNVSRYAGAGKARRASTPQGIDSTAHVSRFLGGPPPPTSPSKRNGQRGIDERPAKLNRHFLKQGDRKDTPAPTAAAPAFGLNRPSTSAFSLSMSLQGGERARQAAAASKLSPLFPNNVWPEDLESRRRRVGSLSSAADSGADLSSYSGNSNIGCQDADGDIDMFAEMVEEPEPVKRDLLDVLPNELSIAIFELLEAQDIINCELVSKRWLALTKEMSVWRRIFLRKFDRRIYTDPPPIQVGGIGIGRPNVPNQQWKRMYKARTLLERNWRQGAEGAGKAIYLAGHTDSVYCVQFDEEKIITGSRDRTIRVWDINNFTCIRVIGGPDSKPVIGPKVLRTVDYPDFHLATASVNGTPYGNNIYKVPKEWHNASILCLQYDDEILVTGSSDNDLIVWDVKTYEPIKRLTRHTGGVLDVALDANHIVSCSKDSRIIVWNRKTLEPKGELSGHRGPVNAVQMRGKHLVSASGDGIARLWDLELMKLVKEFSAKERGLAAVEFSEDMQYVLAGGNDTITYKFETESGKEVKQFVGHSQLVRSLWLDSQNSRVVSGSYDLDLRVYDFDTGAEIWRAEEWTTSWMLAAKSDYRRIVATSQDGRLLMIDFGLKKMRTPDDGQPIDGVDLLRGNDCVNIIEWTDPWEKQRQQDREKLRARMANQRTIEGLA
jgi:F-box and WD-40 domain protein 1/11